MNKKYELIVCWGTKIVFTIIEWIAILGVLLILSVDDAPFKILLALFLIILPLLAIIIVYTDKIINRANILIEKLKG